LPPPVGSATNQITSRFSHTAGGNVFQFDGDAMKKQQRLSLVYPPKDLKRKLLLSFTQPDNP